MPLLVDYPKELFKPHNLRAALDDGTITSAELVLLDRSLERERCMTDLYYLAHEVLDYRDLAPAHHALCNVVQSVNPLIITLRDRAAGAIYKEGGQVNNNNSQIIQPLAGADSTSGEGGGGSRILTPTQNSANFLDLKHIRFTPPSVGSLSDSIKFHEESRTRLFLLFRGAFKTTLITIAHTIQLMLIWPDIRILIASHKKEGGSQNILEAIKRHFIGNERFRKLFPEYCPKPNQLGQIEWGTSERVTLPNRSGNFVVAEATIEIAGSTTDVTGRHYNYIKADDLVTRESVTNETMLAKTDQFAALLNFLFDQPEWGLIDYIGTHYHFADLYSTLREKDVTSVILKCWDKDHNPTIPERFTKNGIEAIKAHPTMTSVDFANQYELDPIAAEDQIFRPDWWKRADFYYDHLPSNLKVYVLVDPANTQRKESDYTALLTIGIDPSGDVWLIDIIRDKLTLDARAQLVYKILKKHGIHMVHYESVGFQSSDCKVIKEMGATNDWYIAVTEVKASKQSKEDRIRGLQYLYEQGKVHWPKRYEYFSKYHGHAFNMVEVFQKELWMFPKCDKDDLADCHSFILRTGMLKGSVPKEAAQSDDMFQWLQKMVRDSKKKSSGTFTGNNQGFREIPSQRSWR